MEKTPGWLGWLPVSILIWTENSSYEEKEEGEKPYFLSGEDLWMQRKHALERVWLTVLDEQGYH